MDQVQTTGDGTMPAEIFTQFTASVTERKPNPMATVAVGGGEAVAIMDGNHPAFYCVPAKAYEAQMDRLDDAELNVVADVRRGEQSIPINLDEL
jgi:antitoxin StbD